MRSNKGTKERNIERNRNRLLRGRNIEKTQGNRERAQMENNSNPRKIKMLSGWFGNEEYVQNIWIILPFHIKREDFIRRFNRSFKDVGEI